MIYRGQVSRSELIKSNLSNKILIDFVVETQHSELNDITDKIDKYTIY